MGKRQKHDLPRQVRSMKSESAIVKEIVNEFHGSHLDHGRARREIFSKFQVDMDQFWWHEVPWQRFDAISKRLMKKLGQPFRKNKHRRAMHRKAAGKNEVTQRR